MYSTLCSLMLASSSLTAGQSFFSGGCGSNNNCNDEGFGKYGSYGSYGSYGRSINCSNGGCGSGGPFSGMGGGPFGGMYGQNILPGQSFPYTPAAPCTTPDKQDKKVVEILQSFEEKLRDMEKRMLETDGMGEAQLKRHLDAVEKKWANQLADSHAKILTSIQELRSAATQSQPVNSVDVAQQLKDLAEKVAALKKDDPHVAILEKYMVTMADTLSKSSNNDDLKASYKELSQAIRDSKSTAPNLHAWHLDPKRGLIVVRLPADARLYLNGLESPPGKDFRSFISPTLEPGKRYYYTLRALLERDGKVIFDKTEQVYFEPGQERHLNYHIEPAAGPSLPAISNNP